ncbi:Restriction endonuclease, type II, BglII, partial [mine drainage metagenome]
SYYEQFLWDLEKRGVSNIDVPVLVIGIDATPAVDPGVRPTQSATSSHGSQRTLPGPKSSAGDGV